MARAKVSLGWVVIPRRRIKVRRQTTLLGGLAVSGRDSAVAEYVRAERGFWR